jgi:hypothetical protein
LAGFDESGFGYAPYGEGVEYGVSLAKPEWVCRQLADISQTRLVAYLEHGWTGHQDVIAWSRSA